MMEIALVGGRASFRPGEAVEGVVTGGSPALEARLFWYTEGKGTQDLEVVASQRLDASGRFRLALPAAPYSFSGKLISLIWAVEVVGDASGSPRLELVVSPDGAEILLGGA
jgi:hypothetical protein